MRSWIALALGGLVLTAACGGEDAAGPDAAAIDAADIDGTTTGDPTLLSQTGLYSDIATRTIAADVHEFAPRWELFSDSADKRRWIYLPPDAQIDTSDMDFWSFPQGTKLWKQFTRGGEVIETRLLWKTGDVDDLASWFMVSFQWNSAGTDADAVAGGVVDAEGHDDIPGRPDCRKCHGPARIPTVILGFSAMQLDYDATGDQVDLASLIADGRLTAPPTRAGSSGPYFPIPSSGAADATAEAAQGYLHANCSGCHNARSEVVDQTAMELRLRTAADYRTSWQTTRVHATTVGVNIHNSTGQFLIVPDDIEASVLHDRMYSIGSTQMPPLGRETTDDAGGVAAVRAWIQSLTP